MRHARILEGLRANAKGERGPVVRTSWFLACVLVGMCVYAWANDYLTAPGEWTVYTAECVDGDWARDECTGQIVASTRYRFRALVAHGEVLFWSVGTAESSGKFIACQVTSGRNWSCPPNDDAAKTITLQMVRGQPMQDTHGRTRSFHPVPKWKWLLLKQGLWWGP